MKFKAVFFPLIVCLFWVAFQGCNKCTDTSTITICEAAGVKKQWFSITYVDSSDVNYISSIYNLANVHVSVTYAPGTGAIFKTIQEDFSDGKFGPYYYTCKDTDHPQSQMGVVYQFWYIIEKGNPWKTDTFQIKFSGTTDECKSYWAMINVYKDGVLHPEWSNVEQNDIRIKE